MNVLENSKKAAAILRRLLAAGEKELPEVNIEFGYAKRLQHKKWDKEKEVRT